jgi:hypothetical protein
LPFGERKAEFGLCYGELTKNMAVRILSAGVAGIELGAETGAEIVGDIGVTPRPVAIVLPNAASHPLRQPQRDDGKCDKDH